MTILGILASAISGNLTPINPVQTNLFAWFDANDATSFTYSSGTSVSQWNDISGNARHWSQATASNQPSRSGTMNGRSTVVFDTNDVLEFSATQDLGQSYTIFAVLDTPSITASSSYKEFLTAETGNGFNLFWGAGTGALTNERMTWVDWGSTTGYGETATDITDADHQFMWRLQSKTTTQYRYDKTTKTLTQANSGFTSTDWAQEIKRINSNTSGLAFEVAEIIIYSTNLSDTDRDSVESYLTSKWGV